jgi:nucleotide-binding universal stress UspA family protein
MRSRAAETGSERATADRDVATPAGIDSTQAASRRGREDWVRSTSQEIAMYQRILVPVDGSPTSNLGLDEAVKLAKLTGGRLRLLHVVDQMPFVMAAEGYAAMSADILGMLKEAGQKILDEARKRVEKEGVPVDDKLFESLDARLCDRVLEQIESWQADVVVLGTHGRRGVRRMLLGSDAELVLRTATVPVLLVRGEPPSSEGRA